VGSPNASHGRATERSPDTDRPGPLVGADRCPNGAGQLASGCPLADLDGDAVVDRDDRCVDAPETTNGYQDEDGCPDEIPDDLSRSTGPRMPDISFRRGSTMLTPVARVKLREVAAVLRTYPAVHIEVSAHSSAGQGSVAEQMDLTSRQAKAVLEELVRLGVARDRLESRGAGSHEPFDESDRHPELNPGVDLTILVRRRDGPPSAGAGPTTP